jgi:hypothetical protein
MNKHEKTPSLFPSQKDENTNDLLPEPSTNLIKTKN